jgi:hypothetical protein
MLSLKFFGSLAFASTLQGHRTKLDLIAKKCLFLGYKTGVKGAVLFDILNNSIFVSRNVTHHEHIFPYQSTSPKFLGIITLLMCLLHLSLLSMKVMLP